MIFKKLLLVILIMSTLIPSVNAWGPNTHVWVAKNSLLLHPDSEAYQLYQEHPDALLCGLLYPDITIIYYYVSFKCYQSTHSWSFAERLWATATTDRQRAFAYGVTFHLIQDAISHNEYIPKKIAETRMQNGLVHPLIEASVESDYVMFETRTSFDSVDEFLPFANAALDKDMTKEAHLFRNIIQGEEFYKSGYATPQDSFKWKVYKAFLGLAKLTFDTEDHVPYLERAQSASEDYIVSRRTISYDPSGYSALTKANSALTGTSVFMYVGFGGAIIFMFWWWKKRSQ